MTEPHGPELDADRLVTALRSSGVPIEAAAYISAVRAGWRAVHGFRYESEGAIRELDVLASRLIEFDKNDILPLKGSVWIPIEAKTAEQWWVFVDLDGKAPEPGDYFFLPQSRDGHASAMVEHVVGVLAAEGASDHQEPVRATSVREMAFSYKRPKREQVYGAGQQALSGMRGIPAYSKTQALSLKSPTVLAFIPVVVTDRCPVVARVARDGSSFNLSRTDWVVSGSQTEIVHVVSQDGFTQLLRFAEAVCAGLASPGAIDFIRKRLGV